MIALDSGVLRGSFTPLVTPFADGEVDVEAFERLLERQVECGSPGVVVCGTSGEPTSLTVAERTSLYRRAVDVAAGRLQVVAATGSPSQAETFTLNAAAEAAGVDALLVVTPAFVKPSQEGLRRHFVAAAERTGLPLMIYNIPGRAGVAVQGSTVVRIAESAPNLVGLKHASADLDLITELIAELGPELRIFCGLESFSYPMLALGGAGLMNAVGNVAPDRLVALCQAVDRDDHATALELHRELFELCRAVFFDTNPIPIKHMLSRLSMCSPEVRPPLAPIDDETAARVDAVLAERAPC